ncbi:hypothetical protein RvY_00758 [Ramazzottius varieornatus]|uniref:Uncharacterized protein n=1 Tax=Ramazzottius varieornatus TaxID=947166 RepID=A0A1D1UET1_RAMVA|nr:hypothetical protein RvY_00758 [Ramazzottius varieornatus]
MDFAIGMQDASDVSQVVFAKESCATVDEGDKEDKNASLIAKEQLISFRLSASIVGQRVKNSPV